MAVTIDQVKRRLTGLLGSLNREIFNIKSIKNANSGATIDLTTIQNILSNVDLQIMNSPDVQALLLSDDETTRKTVQTLVTSLVGKMQATINENLRDIIKFDANATTLEGQLNAALGANRTFKTVDALRQEEHKEGSFQEESKADVDTKVTDVKAQHGYATLRESLPTGTNPDKEFRKVNDALVDYKDGVKKIDDVSQNFLTYRAPGQKFDLQTLANSGKRLNKDGGESAKAVLANLAMFKGTDLGNITITVNGSAIKISELADDPTIKGLDVTKTADLAKLQGIMRQLGRIRNLSQPEKMNEAKGQAKDIEKNKLFAVIDSNPVAAKFSKFPAEIKAHINAGEIDQANDLITSVLTKIGELEAAVGTKTAAQLKTELEGLQAKQSEMQARADVAQEASRVIEGNKIDLSKLGVDPAHSTFTLAEDLTGLDLTDADKVDEVVEGLYDGLTNDDIEDVGNALAIRKEDTTKKFSELGFLGKVGSVLTLGIGHGIANAIRRRMDDRRYESNLQAGIRAELRRTVIDDVTQKRADVQKRDDAVAEQGKYSEFDKRYKVNLRAGIIRDTGTKTEEQIKQEAAAETRGPEPKEDDGLEF